MILDTPYTDADIFIITQYWQTRHISWALLTIPLYSIKEKIYC